MTASKTKIGQTATWVRMADGKRETRTGVIWSVARTSSQWWAQPMDDPMRPVLIGRRGDELHEVPGAGECARLAVLRAELVRQQGIYPVIDSDVDSGSLLPSVKWHCDRGCELAQGKEAYDPGQHGYACGYDHGDLEGDMHPWVPIAVAIALVSGGKVPPELCERCIVVTMPESVSMAG